MIIVTSGHVDHGKTALLEALTGKNTAHLPEEKKRGMTIDLGYAYLPFDDKVLGFIDVPGHEKFLPNMLAGLGGIHYAMLIVAADEGIRAQTKEHMAILQLLHLKRIIVVITKADRTTEEQIERLQAELSQIPCLKDAPYFITSAHTGQGITALRDYLHALPNLAEQNRPFRYAIDRVFTVKGVGTVVTGTAFSGKVAIDDEIFLSSGQKVRIKNIHAQNTPALTGLAGQRLALNINIDIDRTAIQRGDWLLSASSIAPTNRITVLVEPTVALNKSQPVHLYHAASRTTGRLTLLTENSAIRNQSVTAELVLAEPLFLTYADRLILRSGDAKILIGGATVLEIDSPNRYKRTDARLAFLTHLQHAQTTAERINLYLQQGAESIERLMWIAQLTEAQLTQMLLQSGNIRYQQWCFHPDYQREKSHQILTALSLYHEQHDDQIGVSKARLYRIVALNQPENLIYHFMDELLARGEIQQTRGWFHLPEHKIQFSTEEQTLWQNVLNQFEQANGQALWVRDVANLLKWDERDMRNFMYKAGKLGYLTPIVKDRFFLTEQIYTYARLIGERAERSGKVSVNEIRDMLGFGRKLTVQLIEFFDRSGFLRRKGDAHFLRDKDTFSL